MVLGIGIKRGQRGEVLFEYNNIIYDNNMDRKGLILWKFLFGVYVKVRGSI